MSFNSSVTSEGGLTAATNDLAKDYLDDIGEFGLEESTFTKNSKLKVVFDDDSRTDSDQEVEKEYDDRARRRQRRGLAQKAKTIRDPSVLFNYEATGNDRFVDAESDDEDDRPIKDENGFYLRCVEELSMLRIDTKTGLPIRRFSALNADEGT